MRPRFALIILCSVTLGAGAVINCSEPSLQGESEAEQYCGSCHLKPDPSHLDKRTWYNSVLPQMRFRMGYPDEKIMRTIPPQDRASIEKLLPTAPLISEEDWALVSDYYVKNAPDSLERIREVRPDEIYQFDVTVRRNVEPLITFLDFDEAQRKYYVGTGSGVVYTLNSDLSITDSINVGSAVSHIELLGDQLAITAMGIMSPNDQAKGRLLLRGSSTIPRLTLDSLRRPVFSKTIDLNGDSLKDLIICNFGNFSGSLDAFKATQDGTYERHVISPLPGARHAIARDLNKDGAIDIIALLTQGDERIVVFENQGGFRFREKTLLRFPPVYGSSYFELHDFNGDNHPDILYGNGDNGDFSNVIKPYHGIRLFLNGGDNTFSESFFVQMPGVSEVMAFDFDEDGDLDVAAISFFPDFKKPESGFLYLQNDGHNGFSSFVTQLAGEGRWLRMNVADVDADHDTDIVLGAFSVRGLGASDESYEYWKRSKASLLILKNRLKE